MDGQVLRQLSRRWGAGCCVSVLALTAACGGTAAPNQTRTDPIASAAGSSSSVIAVPGGVGQPSSVAAVGGATARGAQPSTTLGTSAAGSTPRSASPHAARTSARRIATSGAAAKSVPGTKALGPPITLGIEYVDAGSGANAATAIGVKGISAGDQKGAYQILIDDINSSGGLLGHKVVPVFFAYDPFGTNPATQEQAMCTTFTQDNKVFAALVVATASGTARDCLNKANVVTIAQGLGANVDEEIFASLPRYATSGSLSLTRMADVYVEGLFAQGFFAAGEKIGLITVDDPPFTRTADGPLRKALARHGLDVKAEQRVPAALTAADYGAAGPAVQSAVLKFSSDGISRVLFLEPTGAAALLFMTSAEGQSYRPRYGLSTGDQLQNLQGNAPAGQLAQSVGVGWFPLADVQGSSFPLGSGAKSCLSLLAAHGNTPSDQSSTANLLAICDHVNLAAAAVRSGGALTPASIMAGLDKLDTSVASAAYIALGYAHGRRDGIPRVQALAFTSSCSCFRYTSQQYKT
jgi:hypothetical protein